MLVSEQDERGRKFKLALRAGLPILILFGLVIYSTFFQNKNIDFGINDALLMAGIVFVTTYFIFFILEEDSQKTLVDHVTGSYNFHAFLDQFKKNRSNSLGLISINNLNIINENYGVKDVDSMLKSLIYQLEATLTAFGLQNIIIGRKYGGEFLVGSNSDKEKLAETIHSFVKDHPTIQNIEIDYRFGVIDAPKERLEEAILRLRDSAVSIKPNDQKSPDIQPGIDNIENIEDQIVNAIEKGRIVFSFRGIMDTRSNAIEGYEIAAKLQTEDSKEILPRVYLPIVNRLGLGRKYDMKIFEHAIEILSIIDKNIFFSFNLSPFSLRDTSFRQTLFDTLDQSNINPSRIVIELYERKTHHNLEGYLKTLETFRSKGVKICIDNFGSSDASMEYMRHFKFDIAQFDRTFVTNLDDPNSTAMFKSFIDMAQTMNISTIAKWVDTDKQKEKLTSMGINYLQGFGIAKPIDERKLIDIYNQG